MTAARVRLAGVIERRLLINYRLDPDVARSLLPPQLRPQLVDGSAVAGICLIRLGALRPAFAPVAVGWRGEAAAHRIAVEWDDVDDTRSGVFIPVRQSESLLPVLAGGRVLPGVHRHARFDVDEGEGRCCVAVRGREEVVSVDATVSTAEWSSSLFPTEEAASDFFRAGSTGWSPTRAGDDLEGLELTTQAWRVRPVTVAAVRSSYFERLPAGSAKFDHALLMRDVPVRWRTSAMRSPDRVRVAT